jgi:hypothetical protein
MRSIAIGLSTLLVSATLALTGCGGGGDDPQPAFEVGALVNGHPQANIDVLPGEQQTVYVIVGDDFELDSSGPVQWTVVVGGNTIDGTGNTIFYGGATIQETLTTTAQFAATTSSATALSADVPITLYATSLDDPGQVARIDVVITN